VIFGEIWGSERILRRLIELFVDLNNLQFNILLYIYYSLVGIRGQRLGKRGWTERRSF
jgi:hypothetical protein